MTHTGLRRFPLARALLCATTAVLGFALSAGTAFAQDCPSPCFNGNGVLSGLGMAGGIVGLVRGDPGTVALAVIGRILSYMGLAAFITIVVAGFYLILGFGSETARDRARKIVTYTAIGIVLILLARAIVDFVFMLVQGGSDPIRPIIESWLTIALNYATLAALIVIVVAGFYLILGFGSETARDRAKRMLIYTAIGLPVILLANVILQIFIAIGNGQDLSVLRNLIVGYLQIALTFATIAAVVVIVAAGFWLILGFGSETARDRAKRMLIYTAIGLPLILLAQVVVDIIVELASGTAPSAEKLRALILSYLQIALSFATVAALLVIIVTGFYLILSFGSEGGRDRAKRMLIYTALGLGLILLARTVVDIIVELASGTAPSAAKLLQIVLSYLAIIVNLATVAAVIALVVAGFILILGFGSETTRDRAKRIVIYTAIGLPLILLARTIVDIITQIAGATASAAQLVQLVLSYLNLLISLAGLAALIALVVAGFILILGFGSETTRDRAKRIFIYTLIGLPLILLARTIVDIITQISQGASANLTTLVQLVTAYLNMALGVAALAATVALVVAGFILILGFGSETTRDRAKRIVIYTAIGLPLILLARTIVEIITQLANNGAPDLAKLVTLIGAYLQIALNFAALAATVAIVVAGFMLILGFGSETTRDRAKRILIYSAVGLLIILLSRVIVDILVQLADDGTPDLAKLKTLILAYLQVALDFAAIAATVALVVGGFMLILGFGSETSRDRAKRIVIYSAVGLLIILLANLIIDIIVQLGSGGTPNLGNLLQLILAYLQVALDFAAIAATVAIVVAGFILILGFGSETTRDRAKRIVIYTAVGLLLILLAGTIVRIIQSLGAGGAPDLSELRDLILAYLDAILSFTALLATVAMIAAGIILIVGFGSETTRDRAKRIVIYTAIGLVLIGLAEAIVDALIDLSAGQPTSLETFRNIIIDLLLTVLNFMALAAVVVVIAAGIILILGFGSEGSRDRAKKMILYTVIGLVIIGVARAVVSLIIGLFSGT